jgi:ribosomal protein S12 methylthiotransferase accessory factor
MARQADVFALTQPFGGLFGLSTEMKTGEDSPRMNVRMSRLGDLAPVWAHIGYKPPGGFAPTSIDGSGAALSDKECALVCLAEGLERYCTSVFSSEQFVVATAKELGGAALDLNTIARCSTKELAHPLCPLAAPDVDLPIRWVQALSLLDGKVIYVPAVMVYLHAGYLGPGERIWIPITTGCAAHRSYERALLSAILEVIERDAISLVWLQSLPLPKIEIDDFPPVLKPYWENYQQGSAELEYFFFDATTDIGVSTVYGLQVSRFNKHVTTLVSCSAALDPTDAVAKVIRDMASCRLPFRKPRQVPANWDNFRDLFHGATYMARSEQAGAFDFLLKSDDRISLSHMGAVENTDDRKALRDMIQRFRRKAISIFAVDLSTDEAVRSGFRVVRVIIPALQPFSFHYRAKYLGHPRLYEAPRLMGHAVHNEEALNQWPQPFC